MDDREEFNRPSFKSKNPFRRTTLRKVQIVETADGPVWKSLKLKAEAAGCMEPGGVQLEIRLINADKRIEFHYDIRKAAVRVPESVYVGFPFNAPGARVYYEAQGGTALPGEGQLPGSSSDIGDDRLQQQSQGRVVPEAFTHGSSAQRVEWFSRGMETGSLEACDTFRS